MASTKISKEIKEARLHIKYLIKRVEAQHRFVAEKQFYAPNEFFAWSSYEFTYVHDQVLAWSFAKPRHPSELEELESLHRNLFHLELVFLRISLVHEEQKSQFEWSCSYLKQTKNRVGSLLETIKKTSVPA